MVFVEGSYVTPSGNPYTSFLTGLPLSSFALIVTESIAVFTSFVWFVILSTVGGVVSDTITPEELLVEGAALPTLLVLDILLILDPDKLTLLSINVPATNGLEVLLSTTIMYGELIFLSPIDIVPSVLNTGLYCEVTSVLSTYSALPLSFKVVASFTL